MPLSETLSILMLLLLIAVLVSGLGRKLPIPFTVILVVIGVVLAELRNHIDILAPLQAFQLDPELVFFLFLPALIFESAFNLDARQLGKDLIPVLALAVPALLISIAIIGFGLWAITDIPLAVTLLFGALISATDPVAVVALFKELGAPLRLTVLVEGESLFNDATAIVAYSILIGFVVGTQNADGGFGALTLSASWDFLRVFLGGAMLGAIGGYVFAEISHRLKLDVAAVAAATLVLAYGSFILAEHGLHLSGVMATTTAALTFHGFGMSRLPRHFEEGTEVTWELLAYIANAFLFLLIGLSIQVSAMLTHLPLIAAIIALLLLGRAISVYGLLPPILNIFKLPRVERHDLHVMWWGGLKGGLAIAIVLSIPESVAEREFLINLTAGVVLFTLVVNAPTIRPLMDKLGMNNLAPGEITELRQATIHGQQEATHLLEELKQFDLVSDSEMQTIQQRIDTSLSSKESESTDEQTLRQLRAECLAEEGTVLEELREIGLVSQYIYFDLKAALIRRREALKLGETQSASNPFRTLEARIIQSLREKNWAIGFLSWLQRARLDQKLQRDIGRLLMSEEIMEHLKASKDYAQQHLTQVHDSYQQRHISIQASIAEMRQQFPDDYHNFAEHMFVQAVLRRAMIDANHRHEQGEIGPKVYNRIRGYIERELSQPDDLSDVLNQQKREQRLAELPLFKDLSTDTITKLANHLHTITFLMGDHIIDAGDKGDSLYIIVRGEAKVYHPQEGKPGAELEWLADLNAGDFFGELALLGDQKRQATVICTRPATLLRLRRADVRSLSTECPDIVARLKAAKTERSSR